MIRYAYSSLCCKYIDDIFAIALCNPNKAIEWDLNFIPPTLNTERQSYLLKQLSSNSIEIRYHLPYSYVEIAHNNRIIADYSVEVIKRNLDFICRLGGDTAILHVGSVNESDISVALKNLKVIATYASQKGIRICVENLPHGLTTVPKNLLMMLKIQNVYFCFDTGHAQKIFHNNADLYFSLLKMMPYCIHSHIYKTEDDFYNHIPFASYKEYEDSIFVKLLSQSNCTWYTMELDKQSEQQKQYKIISCIQGKE